MRNILKFVFLDANIFFAATFSSRGGSALILELCKHRKIKCISSQMVLYEAERNIREKIGEKGILKFHKLLDEANLSIVSAVNEKDITRYNGIIGEKDAHVLASAVKSAAKILITLDKKHFFTKSVLDAKLPFVIMTPKTFIIKYLRTN